MSVAIRGARLGALVAIIGGVACYRSSAPPGWLPTAVDAPSSAFGSWISVQAQPRTIPLVRGELIAIDADTIHVLADGRFVSVSRAEVCCAELTAYRMDLAELQVWALLGTLSTLSHGFVLILSAPVWAIAGTASAASASYAPRIISTDPEVLRPFARFPQGIPPGLDRATLQSKPWTLRRRRDDLWK